jgi:tryptophan 2,3-dioxygenase
MACPFVPDIRDQTLQRSQLTYNSYLKVDELLELQKEVSDPPHHDEMLFIVIHQAYELWFKQILHEMQSAIPAMNKRRLLKAYRYMDRVCKIMRLLVQQIHILETMAPAEFLAFRDNLRPASGFQSIQFRELEFLAGLRDPQFLKVFHNWPEYGKRLQARLDGPNLASAYHQLLREEGYEVPDSLIAPDGKPTPAEVDALLDSLRKLYQDPDESLRLYLLSESLVEFDEQLLLWRHHHRLAVERTIGARAGTGGSEGAKYLESTTSKRCFPYLWAVRSRLSLRGRKQIS